MPERPHKELDFSREESVHADAVGAKKASANGQERLAATVGLWVVGVPRIGAVLMEDHPMAKSLPVDETRRAGAVGRNKRRQRRSNTKKTSC